MSCSPSYTYRPTFINDGSPCSIPTYNTRRARGYLGGTYFRSKLQGDVWNQVAIAAIDNNNGTLTITITHPSYPAEVYTVTQTPGILPEDPYIVNGIDELRTSINTNTNSIVEMLSRGTDVYDTGADAEFLSTFPTSYLTGGAGAPSTGDTLPSIRTGPTRSIIIISTEEDYFGASITPPASRKIQQWNGVAWISYCNTTPGSCPSEGTC